MRLFQLKEIFSALKYSLSGLRCAFNQERAFFQELVMILILAPLGWYLGESTIEKVLLISSLIVILIVELVNSSIEAAVDRISIERNPLSKKAKDIASAAVFLCFINAIFIWTVILAK